MNTEYLASILHQRKLQQATIFSTVFAPTTTHVLGTTDNGHIITSDYVESVSPHLYNYNKAIFSTCLMKNRVYGGGDGSILTWEADALFTGNYTPVMCDLECGEVNALAAGQQNSLLAGCGNGVIYTLDATTSTVTSKRKGHGNFIHSIASQGATFVSADDSGLILIWDERMPEAVKKLNVSAKFANKKCWTSALDLNSDGTFLYIGGGSTSNGYLAISHIGSIGSGDGIVKIMDTSAPIQTMLVMDDEVLTGGPQPQLHYRSSISLELMSTTNVSAASVFSISKHPSESIVAVAGTVPIIDLFVVKGHRARVINPLLNDTVVK